MNIVQIIEEFEFFMLLLVYIFFLAILRLWIKFRKSVDVVTSAVDDLYTHFDVLLNAMLPIILHVLSELAVDFYIVHDLVKDLGCVWNLTVQFLNLKTSQKISE